MSVEVLVRDDMLAVAREAAERVVHAGGEATRSRGRFTFVLAGGSTPARLYELLASPEYDTRVNWSRTEIFFGDERCVPPDHEWSNYAMVQRTLLARVPVPADHVHRIAGELAPTEAAAAYQAIIRRVLVPADSEEPRFDLLLLGMGDDGHTASLFPDMPALLERDAWVVGTPVPHYVHPQVDRVTLTLPVLSAAREVLFLVTGQAKAERVREVLQEARLGPGSPASPAGQVRPHDGTLTWLLDQPAASML